MRPSDARVRARLAPARGPLAGLVTSSVAGAVLVIGQAFVVAGLVVAAVQGREVARWAALAVAVLVLRAACGFVADRYAARAAARVGTDLRRRVLEATLRPAGPGLPAGEVATLATRGVAAAEPYLTRYLPAVLLAAILPPLTVVAIATQDVMSAVIVLSTLPLVPVFGALVGLATRDRAEAQWRVLASLSGHFVDVMRGLPTLVAFRRDRAQSATIRAITDRYRVATLRTLRIAFASSAVLELVATLSVALVAVVVGVRLAGGGLDLRTGLVVLLLAPEAYAPLRRAGAEFHAAAEGIATFDQVASLLEHPEPEPQSWADGPIQVRDLTVTYPGRTVPAIAGLSATIPARGLTVVAGPSGSGKSTLLAALMGLVDPGASPDWQSRIAWVPQRPTFLSGTVAENLLLAAPEASDDQLREALERVGLGERVTSLDLVVGEDARNLSAGERARLALARVVVARRPWNFLDEPTAHLDPATERDVARVLVDLSRDAGVVVVAHRPALVGLADHLVALPAPEAPPAPTGRQPSVPAARPALDVVPERKARFLGAALLGAAASASGVALTATAGWLIVKAAEHPPVLTMLVAIVGVRTFGLARPVLRYAERLRSHDAALRLLAHRRVQVYDAVAALTPGRLGKRRGDVLASIVDDVESVVDHQLRVRLPLLIFFAVTGAASLVAWFLLPAAGVVIAAATLTAGTLAFGLARAACRRAEPTAVAARAQVAGLVVEAMQSAPELVMWQAVPKTVSSIEWAGRRLTEAAYRAALGLAAARAAALGAVAVSVAAVAVIGSPATTDGVLSGPMLALLVLMALALADVALPLADAGALAARTRAAADRLRELESREPAVTDPARPQPRSASHAVTAAELAAGWDGPVFRDLRLELPEGSRLGVVGPSGSGKSTLAALLLRFLDPLDGTVGLGGTPLRALALDDVRRDVGLVDDDPHVFATTLAENVRFARPDADDEDVERALRRAHLGPWLDGLGDGLGTLLGDGNAGVSGGERARLALARSLLADQPVLVLDEPTAHLDHATAESVAADLLDGSEGRSVVWITHSPVGLDRMDDVLDLGRVPEPALAP